MNFMVQMVYGLEHGKLGCDLIKLLINIYYYNIYY